ncbi:MAG: 4a-hydroxytetrahydrobiopterin dehydratase [Chitinophagaceae bacterium]|nr:4a-hydroxytetrahydrobiopterin dehydratase [Chitinophagaceae bacterium]
MKDYTLPELKELAAKLSNWEIEENCLRKDFKFKDFKAAMAFMLQVAFISENADHHPEIINIYNQVILKLQTHTVKSMTIKDIELAEKIDQISI